MAMSEDKVGLLVGVDVKVEVMVVVEVKVGVVMRVSVGVIVKVLVNAGKGVKVFVEVVEGMNGGVGDSINGRDVGENTGVMTAWGMLTPVQATSKRIDTISNMILAIFFLQF